MLWIISLLKFIDSDFCFDELLGVADEARKDLTKYTAIGSWADEKTRLCGLWNYLIYDITFYKVLKSPAPMHQLDDADYKRLEQSLLLRRQDIENKYNLGNFQDYVERGKIAIPLKTSSETATQPWSQSKALLPSQRRKSLHRLPRPQQA